MSCDNSQGGVSVSPPQGPASNKVGPYNGLLLWFFNQAFLFDLSHCTISIPLLVTHDAPGYGTVLSRTGVGIFKSTVAVLTNPVTRVSDIMGWMLDILIY